MCGVPSLPLPPRAGRKDLAHQRFEHADEAKIWHNVCIQNNN